MTNWWPRQDSHLHYFSHFTESASKCWATRPLVVARGLEPLEPEGVAFTAPWNCRYPTQPLNWSSRGDLNSHTTLIRHRDCIILPEVSKSVPLKWWLTICNTPLVTPGELRNSHLNFVSGPIQIDTTWLWRSKISLAKRISTGTL